MLAKVFVGAFAIAVIAEAEQWWVVLTSPTFLTSLGALIVMVIVAWKKANAVIAEAKAATVAVNGHLAKLNLERELEQKEKELKDAAHIQEVRDAAYKAGELAASKVAELMAAKVAAAKVETGPSKENPS